MSVAISSLRKTNVLLYAVRNDGVYLTGIKLQSVSYKQWGSLEVEVNKRR